MKKSKRLIAQLVFFPWLSWLDVAETLQTVQKGQNQSRVHRQRARRMNWYLLITGISVI